MISSSSARVAAPASESVVIRRMLFCRCVTATSNDSPAITTSAMDSQREMPRRHPRADRLIASIAPSRIDGAATSPRNCRSPTTSR